ncbi:MAG: AMP-binding protein, partial [Candidatus Adiutrix sp.]|nr:AMP-binding protein [Candidatus Adiutrix sp.]
MTTGRSITINGQVYRADEFASGGRPGWAEDWPFGAELSDFLRDWFEEGDGLTVWTSGSTGPPRAAPVSKESMWRSAGLTCTFLDLRAGQSALLCLPLNYIAGKMMVVRALWAGLDLWPMTPASNPLAALSAAPDFAALTPMQVYESLADRRTAELLGRIGRVIIGGGAVDKGLAERLRPLPGAVYSSYGMTETLSHIALRRLSGPEAEDWYRPLPGIKLSLTARGTLVIEAPAVAETAVVTNDLAEIDPLGRFLILGRLDNIINTGGLKVRVEELEEILAPALPAPFAITSAPDERLGQMVVLVLEGREPERLAGMARSALERLIREHRLAPFQKPRRIVTVESLPRTETGKPARQRIAGLLEALLGAAPDPGPGPPDAEGHGQGGG